MLASGTIRDSISIGNQQGIAVTASITVQGRAGGLAINGPDLFNQNIVVQEVEWFPANLLGNTLAQHEIASPLNVLQANLGPNQGYRFFNGPVYRHRPTVQINVLPMREYTDIWWYHYPPIVNAPTDPAGRPYCTQEYMTGGDLRKFVEDHEGTTLLPMSHTANNRQYVTTVAVNGIADRHERTVLGPNESMNNPVNWIMNTAAMVTYSDNLAHGPASPFPFVPCFVIPEWWSPQ